MSLGEKEKLGGGGRIHRKEVKSLGKKHSIQIGKKFIETASGQWKGLSGPSPRPADRGVRQEDQAPPSCQTLEGLGSWERRWSPPETQACPGQEENLAGTFHFTFSPGELQKSKIK